MTIDGRGHEHKPQLLTLRLSARWPRVALIAALVQLPACKSDDDASVAQTSTERHGTSDDERDASAGRVAQNNSSQSESDESKSSDDVPDEDDPESSNEEPSDDQREAAADESADDDSESTSNDDEPDADGTPGVSNSRDGGTATLVIQEGTPPESLNDETCGDGRIAIGEECDDGNSVGGDGCDEDCSIEQSPLPEPRFVVCGDAARELNESCDDGNVVAGDGCDAACEVEPGWACLDAGEPCEALCGDGIVVGGLELCDDVNFVPGDGCFHCTVEPGYICDEVVAGVLSAAAEAQCRLASCGNQQLEAGEYCDDGNLEGGDGCSAQCRLEPICDDEGVCVSVCGDGLVVSGGDEECDDGNTIADDGCDDCQVSAGFECEAVSAGPIAAAFRALAEESLGRSVCSSVCGDGAVAGAEQCDEPDNGAAGALCASDCQFACGNAIVNEGEDCDNGINVDGYFTAEASCAPGCVFPAFCGDGTVDTRFDEQCDDGVDNGFADYDGCDLACQLGSRCGDGVLQIEYESCDDGNFRGGDGCSVDCQIEAPLVGP